MGFAIDSAAMWGASFRTSRLASSRSEHSERVPPARLWTARKEEILLRRYDAAEVYRRTEVARPYDEIRFDTPAGRLFDRIERAMVARWIRAVALPTARRLLAADIGCGTGRFAIQLARQFDFEVCATDYSETMLAITGAKLTEAPPRRTIHLVRGDIFRLPYPEGTFDALTCIRVLNQIPDKASAIAELVRVTRPGGMVLFDVINRRSLARSLGRALGPLCFLRPPTGLDEDKAKDLVSADEVLDFVGRTKRAEVRRVRGALCLSQTVLHAMPATLIPVYTAVDAVLCRTVPRAGTRLYFELLVR